MTAQNNSKDIYQQVTDQVIESLEQGTVIWQQAWNSFGLPKNITTGRAYRGWNLFWLNFHTLIRGYSTPYYLTFHQAQQLKGSIRKGEKGTRITYWATIEQKKTRVSVEGNSGDSTQVESTLKMIPAVHTVFNLDQTEGIRFPAVEQLYRSEAEKIAACEAVVGNMPNRPTIIHKGDKAFYVRRHDEVTMPDMRLFHSSEAYYKTLFHELAHSSGHENRLNRKELLEYDGFGGENYSKEELTAEFTAAFLSAVTGIHPKTLTNSAAYIKGWLQALKNDKRLVLSAASQAQKAADYILGTEFPEKSPDTPGFFI